LLLEGALSEPERAIIASDYAKVVGLGGNVEERLTREPEASFNPRPARVALLVMEEGSENHSLAIRAALWACSPGNPEDPAVQRVVDDVRHGRFHERVAATIAAALLLDRVRHLHMTELEESEKAEYLAHVGSSPCLEKSSAAAERLKQKLAHAISLQRRRLGIYEDGDV
jgi:hypothetical protein